MNVNELRIGNLLDYNGKIVKVNTLAIDFHGNQTILASKENFLWNVSKIDGIKPIPITEECLLKFGFVKGKYGFFEPKKRLLVEDLGNSIIYDNKLLNTKIKHVHQLQNLYFALTGEELIINN